MNRGFQTATRDPVRKAGDLAPLQLLRKPWVPFAASALFHAALFLGGGIWPVQQAEFGVQFGENSLEVDLVAAPLEQAEETAQEVPPDAAQDEAQVPVEPDDMVQPVEEKPAPQPAAVISPPPPIQPRKDSAEKGDGSSKLPGRDATTLHSRGGSESPSKAEYLRNPLPVYPENLRQAGKEGRVLLRVRISSEGRVLGVEVAKSSGYEAMDKNAASTVLKAWKFKPAKVGGVPVATTQWIPINFVIAK